MAQRLNNMFAPYRPKILSCAENLPVLGERASTKIMYRRSRSNDATVFPANRRPASTDTYSQFKGERTSSAAAFAVFGRLEELDGSDTKACYLNSLTRLAKPQMVYAHHTPVSDVTDLPRSRSLKELYIRRAKIDTTKLKPASNDILEFAD